MKSLTRILAATDLSAPARHATERAALVSKDTAAPLGLLHAAMSGLFEPPAIMFVVRPVGHLPAP